MWQNRLSIYWHRLHFTATNVKKNVLRTKEKSIDKVKEELADVFMYAMLMADRYHLDIDEIINEKMDSNEKKYPAEMVKGSSKKYNEYKNKWKTH